MEKRNLKVNIKHLKKKKQVYKNLIKNIKLLKKPYFIKHPK